MHGTGLFIALSTLSGGGAVVLIDAAGLDPARVWSEVERNAVEVLTIVGDVFARPLLAALDAEPTRWDLSSLRAITSSGVTWSPETKAGLLRHVPRVTLLDSLGASEGMASRQAATVDDAEIKPARFAVNDRVKVFREDSGEEVTPGSDEIGLLAVGGRIPVGYWRDPDKTAQTFRVIDGRRYALAGDYAQVDADGTIRLLGRGSACINTGGEKVYPEEVELTLRKHPSVFDCVAVGVPDDRFGEIVVALVQVTEGHYLDEAELDAWCRSKLAGFKKPRRFLFVDSLERNAAGKANYQMLRKLAAERLGPIGSVAIRVAGTQSAGKKGQLRCASSDSRRAVRRLARCRSSRGGGGADAAHARGHGVLRCGAEGRQGDGGRRSERQGPEQEAAAGDRAAALTDSAVERRRPRSRPTCSRSSGSFRVRRRATRTRKRTRPSSRICRRSTSTGTPFATLVRLQPGAGHGHRVRVPGPAEDAAGREDRDPVHRHRRRAAHARPVPDQVQGLAEEAPWSTGERGGEEGPRTSGRPM